MRSEESPIKLVYAAKPTLRSTTLETYYYVFNIGEKNGYIIVAGNDCVRPILGYSLTNTFNIARIPANMKSWLAHYQEQIVYAATKFTIFPGS